MEYDVKKVIGGFEILKIKETIAVEDENIKEEGFIEVSYVVVSSLNGEWSMKYREDTLAYHMFDETESDEDWDALHVIMCNSFWVSTIFDAKLQHDVVKSSERLMKRLQKNAPAVSDEENEEILNEERLKHEVEEELRKLENGEEGKADV